MPADYITPSNEKDLHHAPSHTSETGDVVKSEAMQSLYANAKTATDKEHNMTVWEAVRLYPKAIAWSMLISTCIVMEGESCLSGLTSLVLLPGPS